MKRIALVLLALVLCASPGFAAGRKHHLFHHKHHRHGHHNAHRSTAKSGGAKTAAAAKTQTAAK